MLSVSDKTKQIANGITARIVHDRVTERGKVIEDIRLVRPGFRRQRGISARTQSSARRARSTITPACSRPAWTAPSRA